jgi:uncharacterized membrane protein YfcA
MMILLLGVLVGAVSSFLGIGGGVFLVPILPMLYPLTAYEAIVLSLSFIFISVSVNTVIFQIQKKIVWEIALKMGPFIIIGGFLGSKVASKVPGIYLRAFLILFLLLMSFGFLKAILKSVAEITTNTDSKSWIVRLPSQVIGLFAGVLSGFAGVGSGIFLNWLVIQDPRVNAKQQSPTVNAMMIFVCGGVFVSALWTDSEIFNKFYFKVGGLSLLLMIIGIIGGAFIGKHLNSKDFNKTRIVLLFLITFALATTVFIETALKY